MPAPIPFPENAFSAVAFDLGRWMSVNRLAGGATQVREFADPRWVAKFTTARLSRSRIVAWRAFYDSLRGGLNRFVAYDPAQVYPLAYPVGFAGLVRAGGGAFDGSATVTALSANTIALAGLPAGFVLAAGDLVELRQAADLRGLFRIIGAATAGGSGLVTLTVEPQIRPVFTEAAIAHFDYPSCIMIPDPGSWSFTAEARQRPPATFSGIQIPF